MAEIPQYPPRSFVAGSTVQFRISESDYLPADGWTGQLALISPSDATQYAGTDNGDGTHLFTLTAAQTALIEPGVYRYQINLTLAAERHTVRNGTFDVQPDYAEISGGLDDRSHPAKVYDAICAMMEGKATNDQSSLAVGGRSLSRYNWGDLLELRGHYAHQMSDDERIARGFAPRAPRTVRFVR